MGKLIYTLPLALFGALFFSAQTIMVLPLLTLGCAIFLGLFALGSIPMLKASSKADHAGENAKADRISSLWLCLLSLAAAGVMGNFYILTVAGMTGLFIPFLLMALIAGISAAAGFKGFQNAGEL